MSHKFFIFTNLTAADVHITMSHDSGWTGIAMPATDPQGRAGSVIDIPDSVPPNNGAQLNLDADGKLPLQMRGVLVYPDTTRAYLQCDDFFLTDLPTAPEPPPTNPNQSTPLEVINAVYATGAYNLATKTGCGEFTEECARQLAALWGTPPWGHVAKSGAQNMYNNHAVDAVHSLYGSDHGIWDIITSSVSTSARPAFNRAGDAKPELWRPADELPCVPAGAATRDVDVHIRLTLEDLIRFLAVGRVI